MSMFASKHKWSLSNTGSDIQFNVEISEWSTSNLTISCCPSLLVNINGVFPTLRTLECQFFVPNSKGRFANFFGAVSDLLV